MNVAPESGWANPDTLARARERMGLAREDVARQSRGLGKDYDGITPAAIESWEMGTGRPELRHLEALAQIYVCPVGWFFLAEIPSEPRRLDFRGVATGANIGAEGRQTLARFVELAEWAEAAAVETGQLKVLAVEDDNFQDSAERLAERERRRLRFDEEARASWSSNEDAFDWWRRAIERLGVFCFVMRLPTSEVRGASLRGERGGSFILVNSADAEAATGRTFTLLHEYGHLIRREGYVCDFRGTGGGTATERHANLFASRMLVRRDELEQRLVQLGMAGPRVRWGDQTIDVIREPFRVSRDVIAVQLEELGLAPAGTYAQKRGAWARRRGFRRGGTRGENRTLARQKLRMVGPNLAKVLSSREAEASLSSLDVAEMLDVRVERLPSILSAFREAGGQT